MHNWRYLKSFKPLQCTHEKNQILSEFALDFLMHWGLCAHAALASRSMLSWILGVSLYLVLPVTEQTEECSRLQSCQKSSLCWGSEKWGYTDRRQQPADPFAVTVEQHSAASVTQLFIPWLNLCWCIHKAGQKCSTSTHHSGNQSFLPSVFSHGLSPHCEVSLTSGSKHWQFFFLPFLHILPVYLNPSRQVVPSILYSDTQTHLGC